LTGVEREEPEVDSRDAEVTEDEKVYKALKEGSRGPGIASEVLFNKFPNYKGINKVWFDLSGS